MAEFMELPRPLHLLRTAGWNLIESFGLPIVGYAVGTRLAGHDAGLWAMLAAIWVTAGLRQLVCRSVPSLVAISLVVLTVQTVIAAATGNLWIFLLHFPIANFGLAILFAWTARGHCPLAARLAAEVIGLRWPAIHQPRLQRFFRHVTVLWAGIFLVLAASLAALLAAIPIATYVPVWAAVTIALIAAGAGASAIWLRSVLRRLGIGFRFAPGAP